MESRERYQKGSLLKQHRADGRNQWILRYRVTLPDGRRVQRQAVIGSTEEYRTLAQAQKAADQLRLTINSGTSTIQISTVGEVASHFTEVELCAANMRRSSATKQNYSEILRLYIEPRWQRTRMIDVKATAVEEWLADLQPARKKTPLADPTKQRIRNVFSVLFTHAQRYEFVSQGHNPVQLVRQSGKRKSTPDILTASEEIGRASCRERV